MDAIREIFSNGKKNTSTARSTMFHRSVDWLADDEDLTTADDAYTAEIATAPKADHISIETEHGPVVFKITPWAKYGKERVYFDSITNKAAGKACWDSKAQAFIPCDKRVSKRMEAAIKARMSY